MNVRSPLSRKRWKDKMHLPEKKRLVYSFTSVSALLCSMALLLLAGCSLFPTVSQTGTPVPGGGGQDTTTPTFDITPSVTPTQGSGTPTTITFQIVNCPSSMPPHNWDSMVGTKSGLDKVQKVTCGNIENGALAALVNVRYYAAGGRLDFYVYDNLSGTPNRRLSVNNLTQGDAQISPTSTVITAENPNSDPLGPSLFKEYGWNGSAFAQVLFRGMFPYATHYQAEQEQASLNAQSALVTATPNAQNNTWQTSATSVASRMALNLFQWSTANIQTSIPPNGYNTRLGIYTIQVANSGPGGGGFVVNLFRLDNVLTNIFEVQSVTSIDGTLLLTSPSNGTQVSSPVRITGSYQSSGTILGRVALYDDTYAIVGDSSAIHGSASTGTASFSPSVSYKLTTRGLQEGLVLFFVTNQNDIVTTNQVVVAKVFFFA